MAREMPNPTTTSGLRGNRRCGAVADFLKPKIRHSSRLCIDASGDTRLLNRTKPNSDFQ